MDYTLVPICNEIPHEMRYERHDIFFCEICNKGETYYRCNYCEFSLCKNCHMNKCAENTLRDKFMKPEYKHKLSRILGKLKKDNLFSEWKFGLTDKTSEIYYYNQMTNTITYEYPLQEAPPSSSPRESQED
jgi:hypothetical protein